MDSELALNFASRYDVPKGKMKMPPSNSTFEDGKAIAALVREKNIQSLVLVTSCYRTRRAAKVIRHWLPGTNITVYTSSSVILPHTPDNWWRDEEGLVAVVNEMIKTVFDWRRCGLAP